MVFVGFLLLIGFIVLDFFLFRLFFRSMFENAEHFWECLKLDFRPDIFSFFKRGSLERIGLPNSELARSFSYA